MIELYAISDHPCPPLPDDLPGLELVASCGLAAVCAPPSAHDSVEGLWRHEEILESIMRDRDLLPARLGTILADRSAVAQVLCARRAELSSALDRVRGAVEVSLRAAEVIAASDDERPPSETRTANGAERLAAGAPDHAAQRVHRTLVTLSRATAVRSPYGRRDALAAAYLVDRHRLSGFVEAVAELQNQHPELALLCTGPWPPYSFAEQ